MSGATPGTMLCRICGGITHYLRAVEGVCWDCRHTPSEVNR
jgi:hypothetical protein